LETVREIDADVMGFQEPLPHQYSLLRDELDHFDWYGVPRLGNKEGELVPIAWRRERFDARMCETHWSSETPEVPSMNWNGTFPRPVTNVQLLDWEQEGRELGIWNTHFDIGETRRKTKSAEQLSGWVTGTDPCVVLGDFNSEPGQEPYETLIGDNALQDSRDLVEECIGPRPTGHGFDGDEDYNNCVDHIFVSPSIDLTRFETVNDSEDGKYPSDHFPVVADLSFET
jgi:endonuclease/exonuclease/phosphatase family metal-dependent hydrolase